MKGIARTRTRQSYSEAELFAERRSKTTTLTNPNPPWGSFSTQVDQFPEYSPRRDICSDVSGNRGGDNPLTVIHETVELPRFVMDLTINHQYPSPVGLFRNWRVDYQVPVEANVAHTGQVTDNDIVFVTRAANATNPSAAEFDIAQFVGELRDAPKLLKFAGDKLTKFGANEYLKYQYGWKPFIRDIRNLINGVDRLDKTMNRLRTLRSGDVLRSRFEPFGEYEMFNESFFADINYPSPWGFGDNIAIEKSFFGSIHRWCICRYKADRPEGLPQTDPELLALARKAAWGMTIDGKTAWELMPWSWLIDWTTNHSEFIGSKRNVVGASLSGTVLMRTTSTFVQYTPKDLSESEPSMTMNSFTGFPGHGRYVAKERFIDVMPAAINTGEINLLKTDPFKQSILGALALQRLKGLPF